MKGWIRRTWMGCVVAMSLGVPVAHADGGTVTFSGAVMTPTCGMSSVGEPPAAPTSRTRFGCGGAADRSFSAKAPQAYTVSVESLESSALNADRLVSYFSGYVHAASSADVHMQLVTQAYD